MEDPKGGKPNWLTSIVKYNDSSNKRFQFQRGENTKKFSSEKI